MKASSQGETHSFVSIVDEVFEDRIPYGLVGILELCLYFAFNNSVSSAILRH